MNEIVQTFALVVLMLVALLQLYVTESILAVLKKIQKND